jgi:hypothetical protein
MIYEREKSNPIEFKTLYGMSVQEFEVLLANIKLKNIFKNSKVSIEDKLLIGLKYNLYQGSFAVLGQELNISPTAVYKIVKKINDYKLFNFSSP